MNELFYGDNLDILRDHIDDKCVDMIYIDPPFNSKKDYNIIYDGASAQAEVFKDTWSLSGWQMEKKMIFFDDAQRYQKIHNIISVFEKLLINTSPSLFAYLVHMSIRIVELHRVLKPTGTLFLHCDPTASHYLKIILDEVFGRNNFLNEIVWCYTSGGVSSRYFGRKHDVILFYAKSNKYKFNTQYREYSKKTKQRGLTKVKGKYFASGLREEGAVLQDWWTIQPVLSPTAKERLHYPTQKPEMLLEQIIRAGSNENDVVLDAFCGCGTTVAVAQQLKRKWIGIDITFLSIDLIRQRLLDSFYRDIQGLNEKKAKSQFDKDVKIFGIPRDIEGARQLATKTKGDRIRKEFEKWAIFSIGGVFTEKKGADQGFDGYFYLQDLNKKKNLYNIKCLIQVKSGKVGVKDIRDFSHVMDREQSPTGVFITLEPPTGPMMKEVARMKPFTTSLGKVCDRIYLVTIQDIIDGVLPQLPIQRITKRAQRVLPKVEQNNIFNP
ncbi:restriction endonuclease [bacterium]|nr:restriction endonuclease [bacterium]